ncbi:hypothetical protein DESC_310109 [Desulfosarcina cetonica]|nr:hypothetical protein DESC_310109 [Desulfosarcina cetonica]
MEKERTAVSSFGILPQSLNGSAVDFAVIRPNRRKTGNRPDVAELRRIMQALFQIADTLRENKRNPKCNAFEKEHNGSLDKCQATKISLKIDLLDCLWHVKADSGEMAGGRFHAY